MLAEVEVHICMRHVAEEGRSRRRSIFSAPSIWTGSISKGRQALWITAPVVNDQDTGQVQQGAPILITNWTVLWREKIMKIHYGRITPRENLCPLGTVMEDSSMKTFLAQQCLSTSSRMELVYPTSRGPTVSRSLELSFELLGDQERGQHRDAPVRGIRFCQKNLPFRFAPVVVVVFSPFEKGIPLFFPKRFPKEGVSSSSCNVRYPPSNIENKDLAIWRERESCRFICAALIQWKATNSINYPKYFTLHRSTRK